MTALKVDNLDVAIGGNLVLENINLEIKEKEFLGIIGPNGGGKTTLLKTLIGLIKPERGTVSVFGRPGLNGRKYIGYVPQYSSFDQHYPISVREVVYMGRLDSVKLFHRFSKEDMHIVEYALNRVGMLEFKDRLIRNLSGGERQRVMIARALARDPKILLFDEPTASVDSAAGKTFYEILKSLNEEKTIILVSHDIGAVSQYVKKIACLNKKLIFHDSKEVTAEMLENTYQCPVDLIAHGVAHRVLDKH